MYHEGIEVHSQGIRGGSSVTEWSRDHAEQELAAWAAANEYRDEIIKGAYRAGVTKARIHAITGVARTTIDRVLQDPSPRTGPVDSAARRALTAFLGEFTDGWPRQPVQFGGLYPLRRPPVAQQFTPEQLAEQLLASTAFRALRLGTWLSTPKGEFIAAAIEALVPPLYQMDIDLLIDAVKLAAKAQQREARDKAVGIGLVVAIGGALIAGSRQS
jgi:hypothetical protein